jgi:hypothetical protein
MSLSLSPRYDLIRFHIPKSFLPPEIEAKYTAMLNKDANIMNTAIDYLNESIQGITMPGISDLTIQQQQHSANSIERQDYGGVKKINVDTSHEVNYLGTSNPLERIDKEFKVTFRTNQGLLNYFMLYETAFYYACKEYEWECEPVMYIEMLNEDGTVLSVVKFMDVFMNGMDGLDFNYTKVERESNTFDVTFKFNNIDYEYYIDKNYRDE